MQRRPIVDAMLERLSTNEAAIGAGVSVDDINRAIGRKILPSKLYSTVTSRTVWKDACLWIFFLFRNCRLPDPGRPFEGDPRRLWSLPFVVGVEELSGGRVTDNEVSFSHIWEDVDRRLNQLKEAQEMVIEDPAILSGTPASKGSRIPEYDVASLVDSGTAIQELLELYPRLKKEQFDLAYLYAKANPQRGRPKSENLPERGGVPVTKFQF